MARDRISLLEVVLTLFEADLLRAYQLIPHSLGTRNHQCQKTHKFGCLKQKRTILRLIMQVAASIASSNQRMKAYLQIKIDPRRFGGGECNQVR